jgi:hypothetical protein
VLEGLAGHLANNRFSEETGLLGNVAVG